MQSKVKQSEAKRDSITCQTQTEQSDAMRCDAVRLTLASSRSIPITQLGLPVHFNVLISHLSEPVSLIPSPHRPSARSIPCPSHHHMGI